MAISEKSVIDKIEILENGVMQVRDARVIMDGAVELTRLYNRRVISPGDDVSKEAPVLKAISNIVQTPPVIKAFKDALALKEKL